MRERIADRPFLIVSLLLIGSGVIIFASASLGLLAKDALIYSDAIGKQILFGLLPGLALMYFFSRVHYTFWRKYAFYIFLFSIVATLLVFVPGLGFSHGGARRWIDIMGISFQPAEFLKLGFILYFATWLASIKSEIQTFKYGLLPVAIILGVVSLILLAQPHTGFLIVILISALSMFLVSGGKWKHLLIFLIIGIMGLSVLFYTRPYVRERIVTFVNPTLVNPLDEGYQIRQSLIAIGSGGIAGRGLGQSIQKFSYLPEPVGDSIFAVAAEEFGFIGSSMIVTLYLLFSVMGLRIAARAPDVFGRLLAVGIVILISSQSFINIGAMLGLLPISGVPIVFLSQGGTALLFALLEVGILLNISKYQHI